MKENISLARWTIDDRDFLVNTMKVGGPTLGDLTTLAVRGLKGQDLRLYFADLRKVITGLGFNAAAFKCHIDKLLALPTFKHRFVDEYSKDRERRLNREALELEGVFDRDSEFC